MNQGLYAYMNNKKKLKKEMGYLVSTTDITVCVRQPRLGEWNQEESKKLLLDLWLRAEKNTFKTPYLYFLFKASAYH
jgi:hypothetical protein